MLCVGSALKKRYTRKGQSGVLHIQPFVLPFSSAMETTTSPLHSQDKLLARAVARFPQELRDALS